MFHVHAVPTGPRFSAAWRTGIDHRRESLSGSVWRGLPHWRSAFCVSNPCIDCRSASVVDDESDDESSAQFLVSWICACISFIRDWPIFLRAGPGALLASTRTMESHKRELPVSDYELLLDHRSQLTYQRGLFLVANDELQGMLSSRVMNSSCSKAIVFGNFISNLPTPHLRILSPSVTDCVTLSRSFAGPSLGPLNYESP